MTTPGIGASTILGIAIEDLNTPTQSALATATTGGTITAGTYRYAVTAINANGETTISNEQSITTTGSTSTVTVTWGSVTGATGYKLYKTAAGGAAGTELLYKTVGAVTSDVDTAPGSPAGAIPTANTATNPGVYVAPTKFIPFIDSGIKYVQDTQWRRPLRNTPGLVGAVAGNSRIEGDLTMEALSDCVPYFLHASRCTFTKSGSGPYTYTYTPAAIAIPARTLSITLVKNGITFGYTGCVATGLKFMIDNGMLRFVCSILGRDEASESLPVATWPTSTPFGAGSYNVQIPTATQVFDADTFEFNSNDNGNAQYRLKNTGTGAQFINFGESAATLSIARDFFARTDYDAFKALTSQSVTLVASKGASESITILMPVAFKDDYDIPLGGQGDLIRATSNYQGAIDGTGKHYQITVITPTENIL